jgi:hypothetical protein
MKLFLIGGIVGLVGAAIVVAYFSFATFFATQAKILRSHIKNSKQPEYNPESEAANETEKTRSVGA